MGDVVVLEREMHGIVAALALSSPGGRKIAGTRHPSWPRAKLELHNAPTDAMTWPAPLAAGRVDRVDSRVAE